MSETFTPNYNLSKPPVGGLRDQWGQRLNANMDLLDATVKAVDNRITTVRSELLNLTNAAQATADSRVLRSGDTMTGLLVIAPPAASGSGGALVLRKAAGTLGAVVLGQQSSIATMQINLAAGAANDLSIDRFDNGGAYAGTPLIISRANGQISVNSGMAVAGGMTVSGGMSASGATVFNSGGVTVNNGALTLLTEGTASNHAMTRGYIDDRIETRAAAYAAERVALNGTTAMSGNLQIQTGSPTIHLRDTDHLSASIHVNSNLLYFIRGSVNNTDFVTVNGRHIAIMDLSNGWLTTAGGVNAFGELQGHGFRFTNPGEGANDTGMFWGGDGNIQFHTNGAPRYFMNPGGDFTAAGNVVAFSDAKLKRNIQTITDALTKVEALRGVSFELIDSGARHIGVVAQEVEKVLPEVVTETNGTKGVAYGNLVGVLIEAIKELNAKCEHLQQQIDDLGFEME